MMLDVGRGMLRVRNWWGGALFQLLNKEESPYFSYLFISLMFMQMYLQVSQNIRNISSTAQGHCHEPYNLIEKEISTIQKSIDSLQQAGNHIRSHPPSRSDPLLARVPEPVFVGQL